MKSIDHNSLVSHLTGYLDSLSKDLELSYLRHSDWVRDFSRLRHELAQKGSRILTLDMPALGKHFDKCLDQGRYIPSKLYLGRVTKKGPQVPVFLRNLYLQVFDHEGKLRESPNPEVIFLLRVLFAGAKKLRLPFSDRSMLREVQSFTRIEQEIVAPTLAWDDDDLFVNSRPGHPDMQSGWFGSFEGGVEGCGNSAAYFSAFGERHPTVDRNVHLGNLRELTYSPSSLEPVSHEISDRELEICQQTADIISAQFGDFHNEEASELPKHGPGAVAEGGRRINKYAFLSWPRKLQATFPADYYGSPRLGVPLESEGESLMTAKEPPSRLIAVPKTQKGPRLIAAEPMAHQWIQQLVKNQLEGRLANTFLGNSISFRDQSLSGDAALRGSVDGSLATIDLSSASDRLSCWLVERMFRVNPTLLVRLHACRTRWLTYRRPSGAAEYIRLRKFAPMGSAVTFPVQSIIYGMIAVASILIVEKRRVTSRNIEVVSRRVRVFGDDIIVPKEAYKVVVSLLEAFGLRVNPDKTFGDGNFRESCGVDAWRGDDVTPPYLLSAATSNRMNELGSAVAVRNNFYRKGFWHVAYWLDDQMSRYKRFIPDIPAQSSAAGRASFLGVNDSLCRTRYNKKLHREEVQVILPHRKRDLGAMAGVHRLFQWFIEKPLPDVHWMSGWTKDEDVYSRPGWVPKDFILALTQVRAIPLA